MNDLEKENTFTGRWAFKTIWSKSNDPEIKQLASEGYNALTKNIGDNRKIDGTFTTPDQQHEGDHSTKPFKYTPPVVVKLPISMPMTPGFLTSSGKAKGLVIHSTEGRIGGKDQASNVLSYLASQGYGCLTMDEDGIIYHGDKGLNARGAHAGSGSWNGITNGSSVLFGMEVCSPGKVVKKGDVFYYDGGTQKIPANLVPRIRYGGKEYGVEGYYMAFSEEQETALLNFCLWQLATNPEFKIENICCHSEWAPGRKSDPGHSFSYTPAQFRAKVLELSKIV